MRGRILVAILSKDTTLGISLEREPSHNGTRFHDYPYDEPGLNFACKAKAAVIMMTKTAAGELARRGIRVNTVAPGFMKTPMHDEQVAAGVFDEGHYLGAIPVGRFGLPGEVAKAVRLLCPGGASCITGSCLVVDGGLTSVAIG